MDNTTLHTFLFHCPAALRRVVLLGSWDNFTKPYPLTLDARRGRSFWRGCFTFTDIICDGDLQNLPPKRDGLLKMGGTYWYYFKVDDDDECHDPAEPSTTFCPLLPGQRLNVLELPSEGHSRSHSEPSNSFTRNPSDRYLNPVPPAPLALRSPHLQSSEALSMPAASPWAPRSATYPPPSAFLSPNVVRHARSASASPNMPSTPLFADFRSLKDKIASKRSASRSRSSSKPQELEISSPMLISSTHDELMLVPLAEVRRRSGSVTQEKPTIRTSGNRPVPTINKEFSPLSSHPVDPQDPIFFQAGFVANDQPRIQRRRSHVASTVITSEYRLSQNRGRANSADTRRTQHYVWSKDPWLSSPKLQQDFDVATEEKPDVPPMPMPLLQRPATSLAPPSVGERPTSSHGEFGMSSLQQAPLDKELPELPRYLTPAPLFACNSPCEAKILINEVGEESFLCAADDDEEDDVLDDFIMQYESKPRSHFSTWTEESTAYTFATSEADTVLSPTLSSFTSNFSESSIHHPSMRISHASTFKTDSKRTSTIFSSEDEEITTPAEDSPNIHLSATPPQLDDLRVSTFSSDLFNLDIQHADAAPRRQAACFGLGFHYSLPEDETTSKTTITEHTSSLEAAPTVNVQRESSVGQFDRLMDDFGYLGDAVI